MRKSSRGIVEGRPGLSQRTAEAVRELKRRDGRLSHLAICRALGRRGIAVSDKTVARILAGEHTSSPDPVDFDEVCRQAHAAAAADRRDRRDVTRALQELGLNHSAPRLSIEEVGPQLGLKAEHSRRLAELIRARRVPAG